MPRGHSCSRCGQVFPRSENLRRHLARKTPCINNSNLRNTHIPTDVSYDPLPDTIETFTEPVCPFCGKRFSTITNRNKHTRYVCRSFLDARMNSVVRSTVTDHLRNIEQQMSSSDTLTKEKALQIIRDEIRRLVL